MLADMMVDTCGRQRVSWAAAPGTGLPSRDDTPVRGGSSPGSPGVGAHQLVDLGERRVLDVQAVGGDPVQGCVVQHHLGGGQKRVTNLWAQKEQELCLALGSET